MKRVSIRRSTPRGHRARRTLVAVGAIGMTAEGVRRWRHRHNGHDQQHEPEPVEPD